MLSVLLDETAGYEDFERLAQDFVPGVAEYIFRPVIEEDDLLVPVDGHDGVLGDVQDAVLAGARLSQVFGLFRELFFLY